MNPDRVHLRTREQGANLIVYGIVRLLFQPFFHIYFRMSRIGREHIPRRGPVIIASNHRSFLDPFVIATMARRPMYYVAKQEMFVNRRRSWVLGALGAFPVARGANDNEMIETAKAILARGDIVLIFPEGTRTRPGALGQPRRGVGRLALETGAPVVPVAVIGTEAVRRGWRIRPHKVRIRAGRALRFPQVTEPSKALAAAVTDRIWPCVMLQWEWLGGLAPVRRVAIVGAGAWGTSLAACFARAGLEVDLGTPPKAISARRAAGLSSQDYDIVCLAGPAGSLPAVLATHGGQVSRRTGLLVGCAGMVPPLGTLPSAFAAERCTARAVAVLGGPAHAAEALEPGAAVVIGSLDRGFARQLRDALAGAGLDVSITSDVTGVELAGCARNAAALAADAASVAGATIAGAVAGRVFAEVDALARTRGCRPETFAGLAGSDALAATMVADGSRDHRAGALLAQGVPASEIAGALGQAVEAVDSVPMLARAARDARLAAPALDGLAALVEGRIKPARWTETVTAPESWNETVTEPERRRRSEAVRTA